MSPIGKIAALTLFFAVAAHAETPSVTVSYADLDLNKRAGAETLLSRLQAGVKQVCGEPGRLTLAQREQHRACVKHTMDDAVAQVGSPLVASLAGQPLPQIALGE
jgi:UrcA family protein